MFTHRVAPVLALLFAFFAQTAHAQLGPPYLTPAHPTPSDTIYVNVFGGPCDILDGGPLPPVITEQGSAITVIFFGAHNTDPESCIYTVGTQTSGVGTYPAGSYTLTVIWRYIDIFGNFVEQNLGTLPFNVSPTVPPPTPISAPTLGGVGLSLLLLALTGFAASALRSRRSGLLLVALALLPLGVRAQGSTTQSNHRASGEHRGRRADGRSTGEFLQHASTWTAAVARVNTPQPLPAINRDCCCCHRCLNTLGGRCPMELCVRTSL